MSSAEREATDDFLAHFVDAGLVGDDEDKMVAQAAQADAVAALALEDAGDEFGDGVHGRADGSAVVRHDGEARATVAEVVVHFAGRGGERDRFKDGAGGAAEDGFDAVVQFGAGLGGIHVGFLAANDLGEVRLGKEPERHAGAVVEVGGFVAEAFPRGVNEAEVEGRAEQRRSAGAPARGPSAGR